MNASGPFHPGEVAVQERAGVRDRAAVIGGANIRRFMPDQHRQFFTDLDLVYLGALDAAGQPWATVLAGEPGFIASPTRTRLTVAALPGGDDPALAGIVAGAGVGVLGLMAENRRRNRVNGHIEAAGPDGFSIAVDQSFGNCPQYIQTRRRVPSAGSVPPPAERFRDLNDELRRWIGAADTFFIASRSGNAGEVLDGVDVSHRGGRPGFVRVEEDGALLWPDFSGNNFFNTLGNLTVDPRAGLLFVDSARGDMLHVAGTTEIVWDGPELEAFRGAERLVRLRPSAVVLRRSALAVRFELDEPSPVLVATGTWAEAARTGAALAARDTWRRFTIARVEDESATIRSFYLTPADGGGVAPHRAGQYLPIRLSVPGRDRPVQRTYTLSDAAQPDTVRISVKREEDGTASRYLHDAARVGTVIEAMAPRGDFTLNTESERPAVLLSAGVGITPMIAMLNELVREGVRTGRFRQVFFIHGARDGGEAAFGDHLRRLALQAPGVNLHVCFSRPRAQDRLGEDYAGEGRVDVALLQALLPFADYDFYLCGPGGFVADLHAGLRGLNVAEDRIRYEFFGPSSLPTASVAAAPADVTFEASGRTATWTPKIGSLLDLAESVGVAVESSCRSGRCGSCAVPLVRGEVGYATLPLAQVPEGHALICQAHPVGAVVLGA